MFMGRAEKKHCTTVHGSVDRIPMLMCHVCTTMHGSVDRIPMLMCHVCVQPNNEKISMIFSANMFTLQTTSDVLVIIIIITMA